MKEPVQARLLEDDLCRAFAEEMARSGAFKNWVLSRTKFSDRGFQARVLKDEQIAARPKVLPERWWRHWFWKIPDLGREYETDVFIVLDCEGGFRFALHVEFKLGSELSPGQAESYRPRAEHVMASDVRLQHEDFATILVAPKALPDRNPTAAAHFDCILSLEELAVFLPEFAQATS